MAGNSFGTQFRVTTWGESHGPAVGVTVDGCPAGVALTPSMIQTDLDRRRVGQSKISSQRNEPDVGDILSGLFEGVTTGAPISIVIRNKDAHSASYDGIKNLYRPGHADWSYTAKYGRRDHRGGGRSSARETACRVAAGAVAKAILAHHGIDVYAHTVAIHTVRAEGFDRNIIENNDVRCADAAAAEKMIAAILAARKAGDSVGGIVEVVATGVPAGLGEPVFDRLDADIAKGLMSINAVKGVEIGAGFGSVGLTGSVANDPMRAGVGGRPRHVTNNSGGIDGGVSTGADIVARMAVKPTPSILMSQQTVDVDNNETDISTEGRHDPCVAPRAVPVAEAMVAIVLADHLLRTRSARID
jgi:chorismate synthase